MRALKSLIFLFLFLLIILSRPLFGASSTVDYLCELGITFYNLGQYDAALVEFKKALMIEPGNQTAKNYIMDLTHQGPPAAPLPKKEIPKPKKKEIKEPELKKPKAPEPEKPKLPEPKKEIKRPPPKKEKIIAPKVKKPEVKKEKIEELAQPEEPEITEPEKEAVEIPAQTIIKEIPIYRLNLQELIAEARRNIKKAEGKIKEEEEFQENRGREAEVRKHFEKGNLLFTQGKSKEAIKEWQEVLSITKDPKMRLYIKELNKRIAQEEPKRFQEEDRRKRMSVIEKREELRVEREKIKKQRLEQEEEARSTRQQIREERLKMQEEKLREALRKKEIERQLKELKKTKKPT